MHIFASLHFLQHCSLDQHLVIFTTAAAISARAVKPFCNLWTLVKVTWVPSKTIFLHIWLPVLQCRHSCLQAIAPPTWLCSSAMRVRYITPGMPELELLKTLLQDFCKFVIHFTVALQEKRAGTSSWGVSWPLYQAYEKAHLLPGSPGAQWSSLME